MKAQKVVYNIFEDIADIIRNKNSPVSTTSLLFTYLKLLLSRKNSVFLFGKRFYYSAQDIFLLLFKEVFIKNEYFFVAKNKNPTIIDCGSNIGVPVLFFKLLYPESQIICFEPNPFAFEILKKNVESNSLQSVILHNLALNDTDGKITLYEEQASHASLRANTVKYRLTDSNVVTKTVPCARLSSFINKEVNLLKMDIEGSEGVVIKELEKEDKLKLINNIIVEFHYNIKGASIKLPKFLSILERAGFKYIISAKAESMPFKHKVRDMLIYAYRN